MGELFAPLGILQPQMHAMEKAGLVQAVGAENCIIGTDLGNTKLCYPDEGIAIIRYTLDKTLTVLKRKMAYGQ
jgi:hypothetical protein